MVPYSIQILLWSLASALATIFLAIIIFYLYYLNFRAQFVAEFNQSFENFCDNLPSIVYQEKVYIPFENGVYEHPLAIALADIAFNTSAANCANILPLSNPPEFNSQLRIEGIEPFSGENVMFAYIFWNRKLCHAAIAFTGTVSIAEWRSDFDYEQVPPIALNGYQDGVLVHRGFYNIYMTIRNKLWDWWDNNSHWVKTLYITGHSLGGALSTICGYDFAEVFEDRECGTNACNSQTCNPQLINECDDPCLLMNLPIHYSFAAPRSGNPTYAKIFNQRLPTSLRINNTEDLVPQLPPASLLEYIYEQTGGSVPFTISLGSLAQDHIQAYQYHLPICADVAPCIINQNNDIEDE